MRKKTVINKISESIHGNDPCANAFLFGSRARGDNRRNSDWDILILVDDPKVTNEIDDLFRTELYDIELEIGQSISILIYPKEYWNKVLVYTPLYGNVIKEGLRLC